jgi:uncharacterized protein (DUF2267 family)
MVRIAKPLITAAATAAGVALSRSPELRHRLQLLGVAAARRMRHYAADWPGIRYRIAGRRPDPDVDDATLADRVRSTIGPVTKRLDLPHVHVMSEDHVILLHGDVRDASDAATIEDAVREVSGVAGVESYLHIGLLPSDTRPSAGGREPSDQRQRLEVAAREAGAADRQAVDVVRAVLAALADAVPAGEREHLFTHLSPDVRSLAAPPRRFGRRGRIRTVEQLVDAVTDRTGGLSENTALAATQSVLRELRSMVPEERRDVSAVLPAELRDLWEGAS